jgi:aerobic-type carbon monoxide dehydrogenase small subunit (CoxS/CutS family)
MRKAFESLVCRCGSHARIFSAVRRAAASMRAAANLSDAQRSA